MEVWVWERREKINNGVSPEIKQTFLWIDVYRGMRNKWRWAWIKEVGKVESPLGAAAKSSSNPVCV